MPLTHKLKAVIFDIDNTLFDFSGANRLALTAVSGYAERCFGWPAEEFEQKYASVQKKILEKCGMNGSCRNRVLRFQTILEEEGMPLSPHVTAMYDLYWNTLLEHAVPFEGAEEAMLTAKELGLRIGICTDMTAYMQFRKLEKMNLLKYVDFMAASEEAGEEKPSPVIFDLCVRKAGCLPEECIFIGDHREKDFRGALDAGMEARLIVPAGADKNDSSGTEPLTVTSLHEFSQILKNLYNP